MHVNENHNHYYYHVFLEKHTNNIKMVYYRKTEISEGIDVDKTIAKELKF